MLIFPILLFSSVRHGPPTHFANTGVELLRRVPRVWSDWGYDGSPRGNHQLETVQNSVIAVRKCHGGVYSLWRVVTYRSKRVVPEADPGFMVNPEPQFRKLARFAESK